MLLDGDALGEVPQFVDTAAELVCDMGGDKLELADRQHRGEREIDMGNSEEITS